MLLVDGKNVPLPNKSITITLSEANYLSSVTTNEQGLAKFSINTTNIAANSFFLVVSMKENKTGLKEALGTVIYSEVKRHTDCI